jgi:hypothetical protein
MTEQPMKPGAIARIVLLALVLFAARQGWAKGMKGNLEKEELDFVDQTFIPILIKSNICVKARGDCQHDYLICSSYDTLKCSVYGITDERVIKTIFLAMLNSGLTFSSITFWRSPYHKGKILEKPILRFTDHTERKISVNSPGRAKVGP